MSATATILLSSLFKLSMASTSLAHADYLTVKGMSCRACEKQVTSLVCQDKEMTQWFEACTAKVIDAKNEIGEIRYTLKPGVSLDQDKMSKIEKVIADSGRTLEKNPATAEKTTTK